MEPQIIVRRLIDRADYSQTSLAKALKVSQPTISRLYNGQPGCGLKTWRALTSLYDRTFPPKGEAA